MRYNVKTAKEETQKVQFECFMDLIHACLNWLAFNGYPMFEMSVDYDAETLEVRAQVELGEERVLYSVEPTPPKYEVSLDVCRFEVGSYLDLEDYSSYEAEGETLTELAKRLSEQAQLNVQGVQAYLGDNEDSYTPSAWEVIELDYHSQEVVLVRLGYIERSED